NGVRELSGRETRPTEPGSPGASRLHRMTMRKPAVRWQDALPCGNGTLGAMLYGNIAEETVMLNHEAIWDGGQSAPLPHLHEHLEALRALMRQGQYAEANEWYTSLCKEAGYEASTGYFQPAFDLKLTQPLRHPFLEYRRTLDFARGVASV